MDIASLLPFIMAACLAAGIGMGYALGLLKERKDWNELIEKGLIPAPIRRRR